MARITTGQIQELITIDGRGTGIRKEVQAFIRRLTNKGSAIVDLDADPFVPDGWTVEEHRKGGSIDLATAKIGLFLSVSQKLGSVMGSDLRKALVDQPVLNANALDFLLKPENQHLIPEAWRGNSVFFWGTIYRNWEGRLLVRCLRWYDSGWGWDHFWPDKQWYSGNPAAVIVG